MARSTPALVETPSLRDARELERSLGLLEARLLQGESWVEEQSDLKRRHEQVSALACESAELHARDSARVAINARRNALRREAAAAVALDEDDESPLPEQSPAAGSLDGRRLASAPPDLRPGRATAP